MTSEPDGSVAAFVPLSPRFDVMVGVGGIGSGVFLELDGDATLGRNESRSARLLDARDHCKLQIVSHYVATLLGARVGAFEVVPIGYVGDDQIGRTLVAEMRADGMDVAHVATLPDSPTMWSVCFQYPDGTGGNLTTSGSAGSHLDAKAIDRIGPALSKAGSRAITVALPEVSLDARRHLLELASATGARRVLVLTSAEVPEAMSSGLFGLVDLVALNQDEVEALIGHEVDVDDPALALERCSAILLAAQPGMEAIVTMGRRGAYALADGRWVHAPAPIVNVASTAGAGDALLAGVLVATVAGAPLISPSDAPVGVSDPTTHMTVDSALDFGVLLASHSVTSHHTIHPASDIHDLIERATALGLTFAGPIAEAIPQKGRAP